MYIAPECLKKRYSESIDLWAMGVLCFELSFGYLPFAVKNGKVHEIVQKAAKGFHNEERPGKGPWFPQGTKVSKELKSFIVQLLKLDPAQRMTAKESLSHPWIRGSGEDSTLPMDILSHVAERQSQNALQDISRKLATHAYEKKWMIADIKDEFKKMDVDEDNMITLSEFQNHCTRLLPKMKKRDVKKTFDIIDADHNSLIDMDEFMQTYAYEHTVLQDDRIWKFIEDVDMNNDGEIDKKEIREYLKQHNIKLSKTEKSRMNDLLSEHEDKLTIMEAVQLLI